MKRKILILILAGLITIGQAQTGEAVKKFLFLVGAGSFAGAGYSYSRWNHHGNRVEWFYYRLSIVQKNAHGRTNDLGYFVDGRVDVEAAETQLKGAKDSRRQWLIIGAGSVVTGVISWVAAFTGGRKKKTEEIEIEEIKRKKKKTTTWEIQTDLRNAVLHWRF